MQELCECDHIIEEKQIQIDQQNKLLVEMQITLDETQRQIEALRSHLEGQFAMSNANICNLEAKLDAVIQEGNQL
jgi:hypothetical protein